MPRSRSVVPVAAPPAGRAPRRRRGMALVEALVGGVILGVGLAVLLGIASRSLTSQMGGERRLVAAWLADDVLNMVLAEGPETWPRLFDESSTFDAPFEEYAYEVIIDDLGRGNPYRVTAIVSWGDGDRERIEVETLVAPRLGEEEPREPEEELDREQRWFELEEGADAQAG